MPHSQPCKSRSSRMHTMKWEGARGRRGKQTPPLKGTPSDPPYRLIIKDFPIPTQTTTLASPSLKNDLFQVCTCVRTICFEIWKSGNISLRARRIKISYFLKQNNSYTTLYLAVQKFAKQTVVVVVLQNELVCT